MVKKRRINLIGKKFNRLIVIAEAGKDKWCGMRWRCLCDCGNVVVVSAKNLKTNDIKSCGCLHRERTIEFNKLGHSKKTRKRMSIAAKKRGPRSKETKQKMSEAQKKRKPASKETRKKISKSNSGESNGMYGKCGSLAPGWRGGISCEPYCFEWSNKEFKDMIKDRDVNKCLNPDCWRNCNHLPLHIHHIDNNKKNCDPRNLITVCNSCNQRAKKDREWHTSWYQAIIYRRYGCV
jgi:hypothetical protein